MNFTLSFNVFSANGSPLRWRAVASEARTVPADGTLDGSFLFSVVIVTVITIRTGMHPEGEFRIDIGDKRYKVDGYCEQSKTVFEFHGAYWHGCLCCYPDRDALHPVSKVP